MKKIKYVFMLVVAVVCATMFTSCDEDRMTALDLDGTWSGNMYVYSTYNGRAYRSSYTEVEFYNNIFRNAKGTGYWVDYYSDAPWDYMASRISWAVQNGVIRITFKDDNFTTYISNYHLRYGYFEGYIDDGTEGGEKLFRLSKVNDMDWDNLNYGSGYWRGFYARDRKNKSSDLPVDNQSDEAPVRHIGIVEK